MERKKEGTPALWIGVDFGAKTRASTALTSSRGDQISAVLCPLKGDVDAWLYAHIKKIRAAHVFLDAPLSLPRIYFDPADLHSSHHFRQVDRDLGAMSPLFLGGLTARAIALKASLEKIGVACYETYPAATLKKRFPGQSVDEALSYIERDTKRSITDLQRLNSHEKDSILAWYAGYCYFFREPLVFGRKEEGMIVV
ncbi:MAG: hypothetical protein AAGF04_01125 [Chlamydiota bacterium]